MPTALRGRVRDVSQAGRLCVPCEPASGHQKDEVRPSNNLSTAIPSSKPPSQTEEARGPRVEQQSYPHSMQSEWGCELYEGRFGAHQMAVTAIADQLTRLRNRSRDADLARPLAPPDGPSFSCCRQRRTLTTSNRSAKRRRPTHLILYGRSSQVVRSDGLAKPATTVCAARCTATLGPASDQIKY
jgi:hypothetical protein